MTRVLHRRYRAQDACSKRAIPSTRPMLYTGDTDHKTHVLHRRHRAQDESSTHAIPSTRGEFYTGNTEHKTRVLHRRYRAQDESSTQAKPSTRREARRYISISWSLSWNKWCFNHRNLCIKKMNLFTGYGFQKSGHRADQYISICLIGDTSGRWGRGFRL
jgi:hypothetical protein